MFAFNFGSGSVTRKEEVVRNLRVKSFVNVFADNAEAFSADFHASMKKYGWNLAVNRQTGEIATPEPVAAKSGSFYLSFAAPTVDDKF